MASIINDIIRDAEPTALDKLGYIPIVGTISGVSRVIYGLSSGIFSGIAATYSIIQPNSDNYWGDRVTDSMLHVGRGLVEIVPIAGGIITKAYDKANYKYRLSKSAFLHVYGIAR